ncbi:MAG: hypothetical protein ACRD47_14950, partial [Nitrososphaeraceae archaeon]
MNKEPVKCRIEIILPLNYNDGIPIEASKFVQTQIELSESFTGYTVLTPTQGYWKDPYNGKEYEDMITGFFIDSFDTKETRKFLEGYKETLRERFKQRD